MPTKKLTHECSGELVRQKKEKDHITLYGKCKSCGREFVAAIIRNASVAQPGRGN